VDVEVGAARETEGPEASLRVRSVDPEVWAEQFKRAGIDDKDETITGCIIIELPLKVLSTLVTFLFYLRGWRTNATVPPPC
jgi:hypothetical protein